MSTHVWIGEALVHRVLVEEIADVVVGVARGPLGHELVVGGLRARDHLCAGNGSGNVCKCTV